MVFKWANCSSQVWWPEGTGNHGFLSTKKERVFPWTNPGNHVMMWKIPMFDLNGWMRTPNIFQQKCGNTVDGDGELHRFGRVSIQHFLFLDVFMGPLFHYTLQYMIIHFGQFGFSASTGYLGSSWHINRIVWKSPIWQLCLFLVAFVPAVKSCFLFLIGYTSETLREVWWSLWASPIFGSFCLELARWRNPSLWFQHIRKHIRQLHCGLSPHASEHSEHLKQIGCHSGVFASYHSCPDV